MQYNIIVVVVLYIILFLCHLVLCHVAIVAMAYAVDAKKPSMDTEGL